jgi:hypothetical protein
VSAKKVAKQAGSLAGLALLIFASFGKTKTSFDLHSLIAKNLAFALACETRQCASLCD